MKNLIFQIGKGTKNNAGMPGGFYWHIILDDNKIGKVFINYIPKVKEAHIQIFINKKNIGRGIGRVAYEYACKKSKYNRIYAFMRKNNIASKMAAQYAGFKIVPAIANQIVMVWTRNNFDLKAFENLPKNLPKSTYVDFLLFLSKNKFTNRIGPLDKSQLKGLSAWSKTHNYKYITNKHGFIYISYLNPLKVMELDDSPNSYELELGRLFCYPSCCVTKIKLIKENQIDDFEIYIESNWKFEGDFKLICPFLYKEGKALISHIPCSTNCKKSLVIAKSTLKVLKKHINRSSLIDWSEWLNL